MRRFAALVIALIFSLTILTSCSLKHYSFDDSEGKDVETGDSADDNGFITEGKWISLLNRSFGMNSYVSNEPYFESVGVESIYFEDTQIAWEWNVLAGNEKYNPEDLATKEFVITTLISAGEFCDVNSSNEEKINCAIDNNFIINDENLKNELSQPIDYESAQEILEIVQAAWAEKTFDHIVENIEFFDTVKDFSDENSTQIGDFKVIGNKTYIPITNDLNISEGDIYILPPNEDNIAISSYKAEKVDIEGEYLVITNSDDSPELEDCIQELKVEETYRPDLLSSGSIIDGCGNIINVSNTNNTQLAATSLAYKSDMSDAIQLLGAGGKASFGFKKGDWEVSGSITSLGVSFVIKKKINDSMKSFFNVSIDNIEVTDEIDFSWGKLHSATAKVDYNVKVSGGIEGEFYKNEYYRAPWHSNEVNEFLKNLKNAIYSDWKDKNSPGTATINICTIPVASAGIIILNLDIKVKLTVEGTFAIELTFDGSKGIQYKNGNVRYIKTNNVDINASINAKAEATPSIGLNVNVFGKAVIGVAIDGGVGIEVGTVIHLIDTDNHLIDADTTSVPADIVEAAVENGGSTTVEEIQKIAESQGGTYKNVTTGDVKLDIDLCFNAKIYPILRIGLEENTVAGKLLKGSNIKLSYEFFGSNDPILDMHIEKFSDLSSWERIKACNGKECSKEFEPFENVEDLNTDEENQKEKDKYEGEGEGILDKNQLDISSYAVSLNTDEKTSINVTKVPNGYQLSEITCYSENEAVATIDINGEITGIDVGSTTIVVETIDKKFKITCAVTVTSNEQVTIMPLTFSNQSSYVI